MSKDKEGYIIFVDNGGTFTDSVIVRPDGTFVSGKADTTPENLEQCFFASLRATGEALGKPLDAIVPESIEIGYGTTWGTNVVVTGTGAPKLGFITNRGTEDRILMMRQRATGLTDVQAMHLCHADKPKPLISRKLIRGVNERIDFTGEIIAPLDEDSVRQAVKELLAENVEGIAVCLLWSFLNPVHEKRVKEIVLEMAPELPISISSEIAPVFKEYPRAMSTIIDLYVGKPVRALLDAIKQGLTTMGYTRPLLVMQAGGGVARSELVKPGTTLHSGPVGGLAGVEFLKSLYGYRNAVGTDVGGTSFDLSIATERGEEFLREPSVGRWEIATPMREIYTIGAGGGTVARYDAATKTLRVGPDSAGANPGPVCYDKGGIEPTVTDADVVLGRIDPDFFLGGKKKLNKDKALAAIKEKIADPLRIDVYEAAENICTVIGGQMQAALETLLVTKGIDPSKFVLFCFGGAGPTHCASYSAGLSFSKIIIPQSAAVFCAFGAATADIRHQYFVSPYAVWTGLSYDPITLKFEKLTSLDVLPPEGIKKFNTMFAELEEKAYADLEAEQINKAEAKMTYEIAGRYGGQLWELRVDTPVARISSPDDVNKILDVFQTAYAKEYGAMSLVPAGGFQMITIFLTVTAPAAKPAMVKRSQLVEDSSPALKSRRDVYFSGKWIGLNVYDMGRLQAGNLIAGPAIIEAADTTVVVPPDKNIRVDEYLNLVMSDKVAR